MSRCKTELTGVFYRKNEKNGGKEKSYYIVYKKDGKVCEEQVGRHYADGMSPLKAAGIRDDRIRGASLSCKKDGPADGPVKRTRGLPVRRQRPDNIRTVKKLSDKSAAFRNKRFMAKVPLEKDFRHPMEVTRLMLDHSNDAIYISQDGITKFVNSKIEEMTGFTSRELMDQWSFELTHPDDRLVILDRYKKRIRGETVPNHYPHRIFDRWGNVKWIEVSAVMVSWEGRPAVLNFVRDITEKRVAEDRLKQSEQLRTDIINFLPDATFAIDHQGCVTVWNRAIENLTGKTSQDMIGKGDYEYALVLHGERKPILIDKVLQSSLPITERYFSFESDRDCLLAETQLAHRGKNLTFWCKAGVMKDGGGEIIGAIESLRDISALKEMNVALDALLKKRENDIRENEEKMLRNVRDLVLPYVLKLKSAHLDHSLAVNVDILEKHLQEIASPFLSRLTSLYMQLSPRETQVASLIKNGMTTKEIACTLNVSTNAIDIYRLKIRKKLGLSGGKISLSSFLHAQGRHS